MVGWVDGEVRLGFWYFLVAHHISTGFIRGIFKDGMDRRLCNAFWIL